MSSTLPDAVMTVLATRLSALNPIPTDIVDALNFFFHANISGALASASWLAERVASGLNGQGLALLRRSSA